MSEDRSVRSSQLISPFGPGSILDIGDESLLLTDLRSWPQVLKSIDMPRLVSELGVTTLKLPPTAPDFGKVERRHVVETIRFPRWMFCPSCRKMEYWNSDKGNQENGKPICGKRECKKRALVPMRFVMACDHGHMDDVPWSYWAHTGEHGKRDCADAYAHLCFESDKSKGSGLDALYVECNECGSKRDLGDLVSPATLANIGVKCNGRQPWESKGECDSNPVVLQRGASNLYYPIVRSALDIPSSAKINSKADLLVAIKSHGNYSPVKTLIELGNMDGAEALASIIAMDNGCTAKDVIDLLTGETEEAKTEKRIPAEEELQQAEWQVLSSDRVTDESNKNFLARVESDLKTADKWGVADLFKRVVLLDKLREVRAFCGFERVKPGIAMVEPAGRHEDIKWLPAIEVFGEGIFIEFNEKELVKWEKKSNKFIKKRLEKLEQKYAEGKVTYLPEPTPRLVLLHTFAHLLIRQLSFECGYSSGSIRERIYAAEDQAGILIYTADSDSEGSLGGLVQQGEAHRLLPMVAAALDSASWCSNDPVCSEMETQGVMGLNKAACHSCTLVAETSCTMNNLMLDRKLILGDDNGDGFFTAVLTAIRKTA